MSADALTGWIAVAASIGVIPLGFWYCRWRWDRRRWIRFEQSIDNWAEDSFHPSNLDSWKSLCAINLSDAEFTPKEIIVYLDLAVVIAKGRTSLILVGDVSKGVDNGEE
ncbi:MAG: hypothetical protein IID46_09045 [Planctomycetes bacterium]|nr:hypothetical protein [Planctomycetota bacterium]